MAEFDPTINSNPQDIKNYFLGQNGKTLVQRAKEDHSGILGFIKKVIHWIRHPNERISRIRNVLNEQLKYFDVKKAQVSEIANLYANCSYFNQRVIKKHNDSWISFFFFWNRVSILDEKTMDLLKNNVQDDLEITLGALKSANVNDNFNSSARCFYSSEQLLRSTKALETSALTKIRSEMESRRKTLQGELSSHIVKEAERINGLKQLQDADLKFLDEADALKTELGSVSGYDKLITLASDKSSAQHKLETFQRQLRESVALPDREKQIQFIMESKFISLNAKFTLDIMLRVYDWECELNDLDTRVKRAQNAAEVATLKAEAERLGQAKPPEADNSKITALMQKIDLFERMEQTLLRWQAYILGVPISAAMRTEHQKAMSAAENHAGMSSNPRILEIQSSINRAFYNLNSYAEQCAGWKKQFNELQRTNARLVSESLEGLASDQKQLQTHQTPHEFDVFIRALPVGTAKDEVNAAKKAFEDDLSAKQQLIAQAKEVYLFHTQLGGDQNLTLANYRQLEAFAKHPDPDIQRLAQRYIALFKLRVDHLVMMINQTKKSLNDTKPEEMATVLTTIKNVLKRDCTVLYVLPHAQQADPKKNLSQLILADQLYGPFEKEYNRYKENKENPEDPSIAMNITKRPLPELVKLLDKDSSLLCAFFPKRWRYHLDGITRAIQQTNGNDLDAIEQALKAVDKDINQTSSFAPAGDSGEISMKVETQLKLLRAIKKTHDEWIELSSKFDSSEFAKIKNDLMQENVRKLQMNENPLVRAATTLALQVFAKFKGYEDKIAYYNAYFERCSRLLYQQAEKAPQDMTETFSEQAFDIFMAELPDCEEKTSLQQTRKNFEVLLSAAKTYKKATAPVQELQAKISDPNYEPSKADRDTISTLCSAYQETYFSSNYDIHYLKLSNDFGRCHDKRVSELVGEVVYYKDPYETVFESPRPALEDRLSSILEKAKKLYECAIDLTQLEHVTSTVTRMQKMLLLYPAFKSEYTAYLNIKEPETDPAPTPFVPGGHVPELVRYLGEENPISKKYLTMIHNSHLHHKVAPELRRLSTAIGNSTGENLDQLEEQLKAVKRELDKVNSKLCEDKEEIERVYTQSMNILTRLKEFKKQ